MSRNQQPILEVDNLKKYYTSGGGFVDDLLGRTNTVKAVDGVDLKLYPGETLGVVGESGCGKTTLGRSLLRLIEPTEGSVTYRQQADDGSTEEIDLTELSGSKLRDLRTDLQYIFQDPFSSLNPRMTVGDIIGEPLDIHNIASGNERNQRVEELLDTVGLNRSHAYRYPHEFSGGQRQRIGIARALAVDPEVIVCDEPVSALDVSVQAQILNLLSELQEEFDLSYIFIAHDLSVVEHISDRVAVMYLGEVAEVGTTDDLFRAPRHPYTEALFSVIPEPDPGWEGDKVLLEGDVPSPINPPSGCRFHTRCHRVIPPDDLSIEQETFRSVLTLKQYARQADTTTELVTLGSSGQLTEDYDASDPTDVDEMIRDSYDIPDRLSDPTAEDSLSSGVERLAESNEPPTMAEQLEEVFVSPCEKDRPELVQTSETKVSCLLYTDEYDNGQPAVIDDQTGDTAADADD
ncbi:ABC transporter ATP-binding protein [Halovenus sp. HT40]|uniref:ABC transporter ATP-binding protein n=1 Tax=Halovenus sp. HT40 TaxID=3126691 RepID=UPI003FA553FC